MSDSTAEVPPAFLTEAAQAVISKMRQRLSEEMQDKSWPVTFSIGVLTFTAVPVSADEMLTMADKMMYTVKNSGKNNISYATHAG